MVCFSKEFSRTHLKKIQFYRVCPIMYAAFEHYCVYKKYPSLSKVFYFTILTFLIYLLCIRIMYTGSRKKTRYFLNGSAITKLILLSRKKNLNGSAFKGGGGAE